MLKATRVALEESIEDKWEKHVEAGGDSGMLSCALCKRFPGNAHKATAGKCLRRSDSGKTLEYCPVSKHTSMGNCNNTPYWIWEHDRTLENAQRELDFLKSLRPKS